MIYYLKNLEFSRNFFFILETQKILMEFYYTHGEIIEILNLNSVFSWKKLFL